jgi:hypothetical protein
MARVYLAGRRRSKEDSSEPERKGSGCSFPTTFRKVAESHLEKNRSRCQQEQDRPNGGSRQGRRGGVDCGPCNRTLLLREQLGFGSKMAYRLAVFVKRELVLQAPGKDRHGKHEQSEWEQENKATLSQRIGTTPHECLDAFSQIFVVFALHSLTSVVGCRKTLVSGHDFSRAEKKLIRQGL